MEGFGPVGGWSKLRGSHRYLAFRIKGAAENGFGRVLQTIRTARELLIVSAPAAFPRGCSSPTLSSGAEASAEIRSGNKKTFWPRRNSFTSELFRNKLKRLAAMIPRAGCFQGNQFWDTG